MDLQPSAPFASASSFPSPNHVEINTEPMIAFEKLNDFYQGGGGGGGGGGGSKSPFSSAFPKFTFSTFRSSSSVAKAGIGVDLGSELTSVSRATAQEANRASPGIYVSPNKIAYRCQGAAGGGSTRAPPPRALPSGPTSSSCTGRGILQRCGLGSSNASDCLRHPYKKYQVDVAAQSATLSSSRITQKIRNLDEVLRNLDHYSMSKRFTMAAARKDLPELFSKRHNQWPERGVPLDHYMPSEHHLRSSVERNTGALGRSSFPEAITNVNNSLARMEFKTQMERLTNTIKDPWPGNSNATVQSLQSVETKATTMPNVPNGAGPISIINVHDQQHGAAHGECRPDSARENAADCTASSTNSVDDRFRKVVSLEHRFATRERSKRKNRKGFLARGRLWVQRPGGKKIAAMLQMQLKRQTASINQRLDKTDIAIKSLSRHRRESLFSLPLQEGAMAGSGIRDRMIMRRRRRRSRVSRSSSDVRTGGGSLNDDEDNNRKSRGVTPEKNLTECTKQRPCVAEKYMEVCNSLSTKIQHIQDQLCTLQSDSQHMGHALERIQKQSSEQTMEIELCWTAINHLCIDNETFREELQVYQMSMQQHQQQQFSRYGPTAACHEGLNVCPNGAEHH